MTGIEKLREFIGGISPITAVCGVTKMSYVMEHVEEAWILLRDFLAEIADQIEDEQDVETVRSDAMEAWEWVREHGGLSHVKDIYHDFRAVVERIGVEWSESELHGLMDALDRRLMPEGCEWPHYEDGSPVLFGDTLEQWPDYDGQFVFDHLEIYQSGELALSKTDGLRSVYRPGERVERPAVLAADGEPLEVGQTVYHTDTGREYQIHSINDDGKGAFVYNNSLGQDAAGLHLCPVGNLTHQRHVLDADGVPIKKGDTVYLIPGEWCDEFPCLGFHGGEELEVFADGEAYHVPGGVQCREKGTGHRYTCYPQPSQLTHTKPEPPDSLERIADEIDRLREDVALHLGDYLYDSDGNDSIQLSMECVAKRCRALAERGERWES